MFLTSLQQPFDLGASYHLTLHFFISSERNPSTKQSRFIFFNSPFHFIFSITGDEGQNA